MRVLKAIASIIKNFMIIFSFIVNLVLVIILIVAGVFIFDIKQNIAMPLIGGLHSSFVGLDESTIDWTIPVRDTIQVQLQIPIDETSIQPDPNFTLNGVPQTPLPGETKVILTRPVPLTVSAVINLPGVGTLNNAQVNLQLPEGLELPVRLDMDVAVDQPLPVALDVRAVIPISETQLHDPINNLRLLFEPLARGLVNLPDNFEEARVMVENALRGELPDVLAENDYSRDPWVGYSETAGVGYLLGDIPAPPQNVPLDTGIVPRGGIPLLDEAIRPEVYAAGGPDAVNQAARAALEARGIPDYYYNGSYAADVYRVQQGIATPAPAVTPDETLAPPATPEPPPITPQADINATLPPVILPTQEPGGVVETQPPLLMEATPTAAEDMGILPGSGG